MNVGTPSAPLKPQMLNNLLVDPNRGEVDDLKKQLYDLRQKRSNYTAFGKYVPATGFLVFLISIAAYIKWESQYLLFVSAFYLIVAIAFPLFTYAGVLDTEIEAIESEIALRLTGAEATEQRAERLFKSHEIDLRRYYQQTLRHSAFVFAAGIGCILIGFCIIGYTFYSLKFLSDIQDKALTAALGLISGLLTNFVAAIYLKMFAETATALSSFHKKLVTTNHLHFANLLLAKISDPIKRDETYAKLVTLIGSEGTGEKTDG